MKRLFIFLTLLLAVQPAFARNTPEQWLETQGKALLEALSDTSDQSRFDKTRTIAETSFHKNELSRLALGRYWRMFSDEQKTRYRELFFDYFLTLYTKTPLSVKDLQFQITDKRFSDKDVLLKVAVDGSPVVQISYDSQKTTDQTLNPMRIELIFALRERADGFYIRDVQIEGQSMLLFLRKEIEDSLRRAGSMPDRFLSDMNNTIKQGRIKRGTTGNSANSAG